EEGGVVLRFRHFDGALTAREEKDKPLALPLVRRGRGEVVFEGKSATGGPLRLTYRSDGADALVATLEKDGQKPVTFPLRRAPAAR
ncbi:MAG TPA: DUF6265 family protein, partial [Vicinamibacteria bacterium]|nr:DUF6265 family protein [Vicinamibacteria bacterium]